MLAINMHLLGQIISITVTCPVVSPLVVFRHAGSRKRKVTFYCNLWKLKSCGDSLFPVSASGYFILRFPEICSVSLPVCLFQLSDHQVLPEYLTLSCVVQSAVKTHSMASHISSFWFCLSAQLPPLPPVSQRPHGG